MESKIDFSNYLFHPSQIGKLMTEPRSKGEQWSETAKSYLVELWVTQKYGRTKEFSNKYMEKGTLEEETSIDLYSLAKKKYFEKNRETLSNKFFIGTPDIIQPDYIVDIKSSWSIFTFYETMIKAMNKDYIYQLNAYMDITGCKEAKLVYCLVNTPFHLIEDEKKKTYWKIGAIDAEHDERYLKACEQIDKNNIFDDIPIEERYIEYTIERDDELIKAMHNKILNARIYLNQL